MNVSSAPELGPNELHLGALTGGHLLSLVGTALCSISLGSWNAPSRDLVAPCPQDRPGQQSGTHRVFLASLSVCTTRVPLTKCHPPLLPGASGLKQKGSVYKLES